MTTRKWLFSLLLLGVSAQTGFTQERPHTIAVAGVFQGYSFPDELGVQSANLLIVPVGYQVALSRRLSADFYTAYARGSVKFDDETFNLQGIVDTHIRASAQISPWALLTVAVNLPTGKSTHDSEEAVVANALSTELLGFREALWGTGFGATTGIATAWRTGSTSIGFGASYRLASEFEPSADSAFKYTPGNEMRARFGLDHNIGSGKLTLGVTFQNYSDDRVDGRDLFAPGNRWRGDVLYSFRTSATSTWTLYATDVWRQNGDVSLQVRNFSGALRDSLFTTGGQNMIVVGIAGGTRRIGLNLRPAADFRLVTRESGAGEGWLGGFGTDLMMRRGRTDIIPNFRVSYGKLEDDLDTQHSFWGGELGLTLRWGGQ